MFSLETYSCRFSCGVSHVGGGPHGHRTVAMAFFWEMLLKICYVDEAGELGQLGDPPRPNDQPVLVVGGLFVDNKSLADLTSEFMELKKKFFPGLPYPSERKLDRILPEIKGSDLRRNATRGTAKQRKNAIGFLDGIFLLLRRHDVQIVARIWIKAPGKTFDGTSVYTSSMQKICGYFEHYLATTESDGFCIADSRSKPQNSNVSHSIFTQKFGTANSYNHLIELPTFGHSDNHAGLQICDIVCSALLYPIACFAYCTGYVDNVHVQAGSDRLRDRYGQQLKALQHRYWNPVTNYHDGGLVVSDAINHRSGYWMFQH